MILVDSHGFDRFYSSSFLRLGDVQRIRREKDHNNLLITTLHYTPGSGETTHTLYINAESHTRLVAAAEKIESEGKEKKCLENSQVSRGLRPLRQLKVPIESSLSTSSVGNA